MYQRDSNGREFYVKTVRSAWVMATGQKSFTFFQGNETSEHRNYNQNTNLFETNNGALICMQANIFAASYGVPDLMSGTTTTVLDELNAIVARSELEVKIGSTIHAKPLLSDLLPISPVLATALTSGATTPVVAQGGSLYNRDAQIPGVWWTPLLECHGESVSVDIKTQDAVSSLNNYILQLKLVVREYPNSVQMTQVAAA